MAGRLEFPTFISKIMILLWFLYLFQHCCAHNCQHKIPDINEVLHGAQLEPHHVITKRSLSQQLRIHIVYDESLKDLSQEKQQLIKTDVLPQAVRYWENTLRVRKTSKSVKLIQQCNGAFITWKAGEAHHYCMNGCSNVTKCGEVIVPAQHLMACRHCNEATSKCFQTGVDGEGVAGKDFILYVSTKMSDRCGFGTTVAFAAYCQLEEALDRPVAGYVNICPDSISTQSHDQTQVVATIKHEILHALGFSAGLFAFFRDKSGQPLTPRNKASNKPAFNSTLKLYQWSDLVVKEITRLDWKVRNGSINKKMHIVVTPKVQQEVRKHFNCSRLEGAELEDQGIMGTALTHWEKRVFENEAMTGTYTQNPIISRITLALMEDTGWYGANYNQAENLDWGKNLGCDFVEKSCFSWMEAASVNSDSIHPYCNKLRKGSNHQTECTADREAVALCNLVEFVKDLPTAYQHMTEIDGVSKSVLGKYGGSVELADYCPYVQEFAWKENGKVVRNSRCEENPSTFMKNNFALEKYGQSTICLAHTARWTMKECNNIHKVNQWGSGCYEYRCDTKYGLLILVANTTYQCRKTGDILKVRQLTSEYLYLGSLVCPPCLEICKENPDICDNIQYIGSNNNSDTSSVKMHIPCHAMVPCQSLTINILSMAFVLLCLLNL